MQVCGISERVARTWLINNEGFNSLDDFGLMDGYMDVLEMAKNLASRAVVTCLNLRRVQTKGLQDIVWWIHDLQTHNQWLIADEFVQVAKRAAMTGKRIEKYRAETDAKVRGIVNFKAEYFEASEDCFHKLLSQKTGMTKAELRYVIRNRFVLAVPPDVATDRMYQIRVFGEAFG